jgi:hypothetical protein
MQHIGEESIGFCYRNPPLALLVPDGRGGAQIVGQNPPVSRTSGCGEWRLNFVESPKN